MVNRVKVPGCCPLKRQLPRWQSNQFVEEGLSALGNEFTKAKDRDSWKCIINCLTSVIIGKPDSKQNGDVGQQG